LFPSPFLSSIKLVSELRLLKVLISTVVHGHRAQANQPPTAPERDPRDIKMDKLKTQIQQLQERLEHYEAFEHETPPHASDVEVSSNDGEDVNPFHQAHSHASSVSIPPHPQNLRIHGVERHYDVNVDIPKFEGRMQPDEFSD
jgi:hypothetical protein